MNGVPSRSASSRTGVTRDDVARLAGVSAAAVSYVINGTKKLSPETEERVADAIRKLGYRPNRAARALRLGSAETLGIIVPDATNPFFAALTHEVEIAAGRRGYSMIAVNADELAAGYDAHRLEMLVSRGVDGVILCTSPSPDDAGVLEAAGVPYVTLNQPGTGTRRTSVGVDLREGARIAVEHLAQHGHRTIGLIAGLSSEGAREEREAGWRAAVQQLGAMPGALEWSPFTPAGGYEAGLRMVASGELPPALFVSSDQLAKGLLKAFHEHGVRVPEDVALVAFDGTEDAEYCWPPLTTVAQPVAAMAEAAIEALFDGEGAGATQVFAPVLVRRQSCGCPRDLPAQSG
ncbi:LacI family DNA-binding transcriptional regulator [Microbacterium stercoris]|uniref:LacI family DNA-binding transcriptional regulator n=1 Tax=Microbacterium stercoris TaxID=2820289 RepID=A0A939QI88_9MICO|nr:LacI family DNA-binding transcriptional regulator [Microbacterium stercoris]MBO3663174.1 LacI family DNA-binding transcriptional regulator [Microbacterium stercoris]